MPAQFGGVDFATDFVAGLVAKTMSTALTYPLKRGVTLIQVEGANPALGAPTRPFKGGFFGLFDVMCQTINSLGVSANYRGATMAVVAPTLVAPLTFAIKHTVKNTLPRYNPKTDFWQFFAANMASGALAGALTFPIGLLISWPVKIAQANLRPEGLRLSGFGHFHSLLTYPGRTASLMARAAPLSILGTIAYRGRYC